jgi:hypothetical protein
MKSPDFRGFLATFFDFLALKPSRNGIVLAANHTTFEAEGD